MARYPGAVWQPITAHPRYAKTRMTEYNRVNLHTAVSNAQSLFGAFNKKSGPAFSHFYVAGDGTVYQYQDTDYRAAADGDGNDATISIETWDGYTGKAWDADGNGEPDWKNSSDVPAWTAAQIEALANLYAWAVRTHGIAVKIAESSALGTPSKGLSWHRLGIDGNFPNLPDVRAGRKQRGGGMKYSSSFGKGCPGDERIWQVDDVFARAQVLLGQTPTPPRPKPPAPTPPKPALLKVDGYNGSASLTRYQEIMGTTTDGFLSSPSDFTMALQRWLNARGFKDWEGKSLKVDGYGFRQNATKAVTERTRTDYALQQYLETTTTGRAWKYVGDGKWGFPSDGAKIMQTEANAGRLFR
jgi:hypothetical protein